MDQFAGIVIFVRVCETLSFVKTAQRLGMTASAVGKSVTALEKRLDTRLFHRNTRSIRLTDEGEAYLEHCQRAMREIDNAESLLQSASRMPRGRLRVGMPLVCGPFQPTLLGFVRAYPEIELDLDFNDRLVDVVEEGFDVVVRTGKLTDSRLMSRPIGICRMLLVGAPHYFAQMGVPRTIEDLARHHCLRFKSTATGKLAGWPLPDTPYVPLKSRLVCSHVEMLHYAVLNGTGVACLPDFLVNGNLRDGSLQAVLTDVTENSLDFHLVWPMSRHIVPKLRAFIDYMVENLLSPKSAPLAIAENNSIISG